MIRHNLLASCLTIFSLFTASAASYTVNNTPGSSANFSDLTTAHAVALPGDTLYIEGSSFDYGGLTVTKPLVFIGPGYFLEENPCTPVTQSAEVDIFVLERNDPENPLTGAAGTEIIGLDFTERLNSGVSIEVSNVIVSKCYISSSIHFSFSDISGGQIFQNYFRGTGISAPLNNTGLVNFSFSNNIVLGNFSIPDNSSGGIFHNLFLGSRFNIESFSGEIRSNIFTSTNTSNFNLSFSGVGQVTHNTAANEQFGNENGNNVAPPDLIFVGETGNSTDGQYQLLSTATLVKNNAHDGTDRGPFGGSWPYSLSGQGGNPSVVSLTVPAFGVSSEPFTISFRAISGN